MQDRPSDKVPRYECSRPPRHRKGLKWQSFAPPAAGQSRRYRGLVSHRRSQIEAADERRLQRLHKQLASQDLLIIDELGFVPLSKTGAELLFEIISQSYERGSIIITSNLPFDEWTEVFGSERLTGAILDRLTHHVHILEMNGESFRMRQSRKTRT